MKKAFTLLELVFVIVVIGIIAATVIPHIKTNHNAKAAIELVSQIRYTQHLAMIDDKYNANDSNWSNNLWKLDLNGTKYSISSNGTFAINPLTKEDIKDIDLKIDSITFSNCNNKTIFTFDHIGRPFMEDNASTTLLTNICTITLANASEENEVLSLYPETGYIKR
jgi:prepilin-type N-terminal cleavage/methylation domain-containing protein